MARVKKKSYSELLRDPRWQKKRLKVLERDNFLCSSCGDGTTELHVHHKKYLDGKKPWDYRMEMLTTLCTHCHSEIHRKDYIYNKFKSFNDSTIEASINLCTCMSHGTKNSDVAPMLNIIDIIKSYNFNVDDFILDFEEVVRKKYNNKNKVSFENTKKQYDDSALNELLKCFDED